MQGGQEPVMEYFRSREWLPSDAPRSRKSTLYRVRVFLGELSMTVLPMGIKQAPALFQRLINWSLREVQCARAYVDDVLVGSPITGAEPIVN